MLSGAFIRLRSLGAMKHALIFLLKDGFLHLDITLLFQGGFVTCCRGGLSVCWSLLLHLVRKLTLKHFCIFYS